MAFQQANVNGRYDRVIKAGQGFLKSMQWDESEGKSRETTHFTGERATAAATAGPTSRTPHSSSKPCARRACLPTIPNLQKALVFVSRCQNLKSEFNDQPWAGKVNDGGFIYTAAKGGNSMAGKEANGGLRSYASMTYAGLKSMIYAGLSREDPRVKAALTYITQHYTLDENPGLGQQGLYYYYHTFAKTMAVLETPTITDAAGAVARLAGRTGCRPGEAAASRR